MKTNKPIKIEFEKLENVLSKLSELDFIRIEKSKSSYIITAVKGKCHLLDSFWRFFGFDVIGVIRSNRKEYDYYNGKEYDYYFSDDVGGFKTVFIKLKDWNKIKKFMECFE